ncbi:MAG: O-antigen ligase family protein [Patescibacteria group bacterium]
MFWFDYNWQIQDLLNQSWYQLNFLMLIVLVVLGYLSFKKSIYACALTIILLPTYLCRSQIWFVPITYLELCLLVTFFGWFIQAKPYKLQATSYKLYLLPILLFIIAATISIFIAPNKITAAGLWKAYFIEPILFFLVLINVVKSDQDKKIILWALGISSLLISFLAIYQKFTAFGIAQPIWIAPSRRRVTAIFSSPNAVGLYLGPIITIYLGWLIAEFKNWLGAIGKLLILIPAIIAIIFTVSQGTWLGLIAAIIFLISFAFLPQLKFQLKINKLQLLLMLLIIIISLLVLPIAADKLLNLTSQSSQNRIILWQMSEKYLLSSPKNFIFGSGILGFAQIQNQLRNPLKMEPLLYAHNIFFNFWLELGLLGLSSFIILIIQFFKKGLSEVNKENRWLKLGLMAAMITILVHGFIDVPYFKNDLAVLFWLIIALL